MRAAAGNVARDMTVLRMQDEKIPASAIRREKLRRPDACDPWRGEH
ncbi:hypothetical protein G3I67_04185 [Orrella sp. NBD-18]|uniref:Uncharacterized protein n=1 Tax=Sheuella amnicola TaxID=2707330 RepID=A0A6B2R0A2_9BURK|nr:hypothetical protein [Sheuella amnicola]NDY82427.1 hypothetical protein [Sheuella amnicola]